MADVSRVDDILALINTGLQQAGDLSYEDIHEREGVCWRCLDTPTSHPDETCIVCRFELNGQLADEPYGPTLDHLGPVHGPPRSPSAETVRAMAPVMEQVAAQLTEMGQNIEAARQGAFPRRWILGVDGSLVPTHLSLVELVEQRDAHAQLRAADLQAAFGESLAEVFTAAQRMIPDDTGTLREDT